MTKRHYDFGVKPLALFAGLIIATTACVSLIYGGLYGFNFMSQELSGAARVMTAAAIQSIPQGVNQMGGGQGMLHQQPMGGGQGFNNQGQGSGQYVCPQHGAVGTPTFGANGVALCPIDGQPMQFYPANQAPVR